MARPKKQVDFNEEMGRLDGQIAKTKELLQKLTYERNQMVQQQEQAQLSGLYALLQSKGKSVEDVALLLEQTI